MESHYKPGWYWKSSMITSGGGAKHEYEVHDIIKQKGNKFLIQWTAGDETWEPKKNLTNCENILLEFEKVKIFSINLNKQNNNIMHVNPKYI